MNTLTKSAMTLMEIGMNAGGDCNVNDTKRKLSSSIARQILFFSFSFSLQAKRRINDGENILDINERVIILAHISTFRNFSFFR